MIGTIEELRLMVEQAAALRPHLTTRLEKAAFLVLLRPIQRLDGDGWRVGSEDGLRFYTLRRGECDCSDYQRHGIGHPCKHRLALFLHRTLENGAGERTEEKQNVGDQREGRVPRGFRA